MNFKYFESLSKEEAQEYLDEFLLFGKGRGIEILEGHLHFTRDLDFNIQSLSPILKALLPALKTIPRTPDETLPHWIRNTPDYKKGLFDFDESSKSIVLAAAYYIGETFTETYKSLSWSTGNIDYAQGNMPVVRGFKYKKELPPILISENIFHGIISGISTIDSIDTAINAWMNNTLG